MQCGKVWGFGGWVFRPFDFVEKCSGVGVGGEEKGCSGEAYMLTTGAAETTRTPGAPWLEGY